MRPSAASLSSKPWRLALWLTGAGVALVLSAFAHAAEHNPATHRPKASTAAAVERIIVKFRNSAGVSVQAATNGESPATAPANASADTARMTALGARRGFSVRSSRALGGNMHMMRIAPLTNNETVRETLARLRADGEVEFAEVDRRVYPHAVSNDPLAAGQWFLQSSQPAAVNANAAWDITTGSQGVVIAVVDTGVRFEHPDLGRASAGGRFLPGYDFVSPDSGSTFTTANDGNGRDADASDPGDWVVETDNCDDTPNSNSSWHGTRVSGIIGARTNNATGVAGLMWDGYILPVRVIGKCGGFNSDVLAGIRWAAGLSVPGVPANPYPAQVINVSLGGEGACDSASAQVISEVSSAGVLVVVSAGNEGGPVDSPANCAGAMGVAGLRHAGTKVGFSSLGPEIAIGAPGGNCVNVDGGPCLFSIDTTTNSGSTTPGTSTYTNQVNSNVGTSFSSPIVSGIAGLMLAVNGNLKSRQLIQRMQAGATKPFPTTSETQNLPVCHVPSGSSDIQSAECICTTTTCGAGMANAPGAVNEALRPIAAIQAPANVTGGNVSLEGAGSAAACGRTISAYQWTWVSGAAVTITNDNTATANVQGLSNTPSVVRLTVTDSAGKTDSADITVSSTATSTSAPANAGTKACLSSLVAPVAVAVTATDADAAEAGVNPGAFTITRTGSTASALTVTLTVAGTASNGVDYQNIPSTATIPAGAASVTVAVTPIDDALFEGTETVILSPVASATYEVDDNAASATIAIADDDTLAPVSISAADANAAESGADSGVFTISRSGDTSGALTVNLAFAGTATHGTDYQSMPASVTIAAGSTTANVIITPIDDSSTEGSETVIATLVAGANYSVGSSQSATVMIADNDSSGSGGGGDRDSGGGGGGSLDLLTLLGVGLLALGKKPSIAGRLTRGFVSRRAIQGSGDGVSD